MDILIPLDTLISFITSACKTMGDFHRAGAAGASGHGLPKAFRLPKVKRPLLSHKFIIPIFLWFQQDSIGDHEGLLLEDDWRPISPLSPDDSPPHRQAVFGPEDDTNATIFVVMLDIILRQLELADYPVYEGTSSHQAQRLLAALNDTLKAPWAGVHLCDNPEYDDYVDCAYCRDTTIFYEVKIFSTF